MAMVIDPKSPATVEEFRVKILELAQQADDVNLSTLSAQLMCVVHTLELHPRVARELSNIHFQMVDSALRWGQREGIG